VKCTREAGQYRRETNREEKIDIKLVYYLTKKDGFEKKRKEKCKEKTT
jgi:hypothetical protein